MLGGTTVLRLVATFARLAKYLQEPTSPLRVSGAIPQAAKSLARAKGWAPSGYDVKLALTLLRTR